MDCNFTLRLTVKSDDKVLVKEYSFSGDYDRYGIYWTGLTGNLIKNVDDVIRAIKNGYGEEGAKFAQILSLEFSSFKNIKGVEIIFEEEMQGEDSYYLLMENNFEDYDDPNVKMKIKDTFIPDKNIHILKKYATTDGQNWVDLENPEESADQSEDYEFSVIDNYEYYPGVNLENAAIIFAYNGQESDVKIPATLGDGITSSIDGDAFVDNGDIHKITIPSNDTFILHECAIESCPNLTSVDIFSKNLYLESAVINDCNRIEGLYIYSENIVFDNFTVERCENLKTINFLSLVKSVSGDVNLDENVVFAGRSGSQIEVYANERGITFIEYGSPEYLKLVLG